MKTTVFYFDYEYGITRDTREYKVTTRDIKKSFEEYDCLNTALINCYDITRGETSSLHNHHLLKHEEIREYIEENYPEHFI